MEKEKELRGFEERDKQMEDSVLKDLFIFVS